jgi:hypothetical protein
MRRQLRIACAARWNPVSLVLDPLRCKPTPSEPVGAAA